MFLSESSSIEGAADDKMKRLVAQVWFHEANAAHLDLTGFDPNAPLEQRLAWAQEKGYDIAVLCSRYSHKKSQSTEDQLRETAAMAVRKRLYAPPEFACVDEAVTGRKSRRAGLDRAKFLIQSGRAKVLIVFKLSRLLRTCYKSVGFIQEEIVEYGGRAISVTQNVDTDDEKNWRKLCYLYGLMDESLIETIADHVRSSLKTLFDHGYTVGALPIGFDRAPVEGPPTKLQGPRTKPAVNAFFRELFCEHVRLHLAGVSLAEGRRRWIAKGGPRDPRWRKHCPEISYNSYRRMLSNPVYVGVWTFGRMTNVWHSKRESVFQKPQADENIVTRICEELRVIADEPFLRLQEHLKKLKLGPRGPRTKRQRNLWDYTTRYFVCGCADCPAYGRSMVQTGLHHKPIMLCKARDKCPANLAVRRDFAVKAICAKLREMLNASSNLVERIVARTQPLYEDVATRRKELAALRKQREELTLQMEGLSDRFGKGTPEDRALVRRKFDAASLDRQQVDLKVAGITEQARRCKPFDAERARQALHELLAILEKGAAGELGDDAIPSAVQAFQLMTGGDIFVAPAARSGRKQRLAVGTFAADLLKPFVIEAGAKTAEDTGTETRVLLRRRPQCDELAGRAYQLIDVDGLSFPQAGKVLRDEGFAIVKGAVERALNRYYQIHELVAPARPYNNGVRRRSAGPVNAAARADQVKALLDEQLLLSEIADRLGLKRWQVTEAKDYWYSSRGLSVPDGRSRRKELPIKNRPRSGLNA